MESSTSSVAMCESADLLSQALSLSAIDYVDMDSVPEMDSSPANSPVQGDMVSSVFDGPLDQSVDLDDVTPSVFECMSDIDIHQYLDFTPERDSCHRQSTPEGSPQSTGTPQPWITSFLDELSSESDDVRSPSPVSSDEIEDSLTELLHTLPAGGAVPQTPVAPSPVMTQQLPPPTNCPRTGKPGVTYMELIARAILSKPSQKIMLTDIYDYILENFPYYRTTQVTWRNAVRHNLSTQECFVKSGRADNGRGYFWAIHPANVKAFQSGNFQRREAKVRVQKWEQSRHSIPKSASSGAIYEPLTPPSSPDSNSYKASYSSFQQFPVYHQGTPQCVVNMNSAAYFMYGQ